MVSVFISQIYKVRKSHVTQSCRTFRSHGTLDNAHALLGAYIGGSNILRQLPLFEDPVMAKWPSSIEFLWL